MPHSSTKGRFLEKCLKSDKVRILTAKSRNTSFASSIWVDGNATIQPGQKCKKLQVKLKDITVS